MADQQSTLGRCPYCGINIPTTRLLIEYEAGDTRKMYAECPDCHEVVHPI